MVCETRHRSSFRSSAHRRWSHAPEEVRYKRMTACERPVLPMLAAEAISKGQTGDLMFQALRRRWLWSQERCDKAGLAHGTTHGSKEARRPSRQRSKQRSSWSCSIGPRPFRRASTSPRQTGSAWQPKPRRRKTGLPNEKRPTKRKDCDSDI
jgi:hypothetical protein